MITNKQNEIANNVTKNVAPLKNEQVNDSALAQSEMLVFINALSVGIKSMVQISIDTIKNDVDSIKSLFESFKKEQSLLVLQQVSNEIKIVNTSVESSKKQTEEGKRLSEENKNGIANCMKMLAELEEKLYNTKVAISVGSFSAQLEVPKLEKKPEEKAEAKK